MGTQERLLERDAALGRLDDAVAAAARGAGRVVVITGEAGVGKTTLVRRFADATDARVLWGGCDDLSVPEPLAPFHDIALHAGGRLAAAADGGDPRQIARALREELTGVAPSVCVLEDCHWADEATLDVIAHVARRVHGLGSVLLVTLRDDELALEHPLRSVVGAIPPGDVDRIALEPLSEAAVAELATEEVDAHALFAATGGNPFLVTEALATGDGASVPATVTDAVLARAARLSAEARRALELVSIVPAQAELWLVDAGVEAIAECERGGLLIVDGDAVRFRHELARRAYRESIPALRRLELNRVVLAILEARGADPARLVHHAEAAHDHKALARHALVAARRAAAARSHREAVALFEHALRHAELLPDDACADAYASLSHEAYVEGRAVVALDAGRAALALRRELGDLHAVGADLRRLSRLHWFSGRRRDAERAAAEAVATLEPLGRSRELAMAYSNRSQLLMLAQHTREAIETGARAIELARELGDVETLVHAQTNVGTARMDSLDPDGGRALLSKAAELALADGFDEHACRALHNLASADVNHQRLELAAEEVERALAVARQVEQGWYETDTLLLRATLDLSRGRWQDAVTTVEGLLGAAELPGVSETMAIRVLATVALRRGGPQAHALVDQAWELAVHTAALQWLRAAACLRAEAAWLVGDPDGIDQATRDVYADALDFGHEWDVGELAAWRWRAGVLDVAPPGCAAPYALSIAGDAEAAARAWEEIGEPYERALALCDAHDVQLNLSGLGLLDGLGASAPGRLVRRRLHAHGVRSVPRGPRRTTREHRAGLSARQAEVLDLVARGLSNREIARALFLTPKTVEHHVAAILLKLRVDSRGAAVEAARELGALEPGGARPPT